MVDKIQILKQEWQSLGGNAGDEMPFSVPIEPQEDAPELAGIYIQDINNRDSSVYIMRDGYHLIFKDAYDSNYITLNEIINGRTTKTIEEKHYYANGTSGNDSNNGFSSETAKLTLQSVFGIIPDVIFHNTIIHLAGEFNLTENTYLQKIINNNVNLIIDGGDGYEIIAGPYTAEDGYIEDGYIGSSSLSFTPDSYDGYWLEIISGDAIGNIRTIMEHNETTIYVGKDFSSNPGIANFRIIKPSTKILSESDFYDLKIDCINNNAKVKLQRILLNGSKLNFITDGNSYISGTIIEDANSFISKNIEFGDQIIDVDDFTTNYDYYSGVSNITSLDIQLSGNISIYNCYSLGNIIIGESTSFSLDYSRLRGGLELIDVGRKRNSSTIKASTNCYQTNISNSNGNGITISGSNIIIEDIIVENCLNHGIESEFSFIKFIKSISGENNSEYGLYAHSSSIIHITDEYTPTLTGSTGYITVDGTNDTEKTWENINDGDQVNVVNEVLIKKI